MNLCFFSFARFLAICNSFHTSSLHQPMEIELGVRRTRSSRPNPAISLSIDNDIVFKLNIAHLKGSPTVKLMIDIKQDGADIAAVSGEREVITPGRRVREGADQAFQFPGGVVIQAKLHEEPLTAMEEGTGGGRSHEKTGAMADNGALQEEEKIRKIVQGRKEGIEDVKVTVEAAVKHNNKKGTPRARVSCSVQH